MAGPQVTEPVALRPRAGLLAAVVRWEPAELRQRGESREPEDRLEAAAAVAMALGLEAEPELEVDQELEVGLE